jgi:Na+-transporting methylmalonyl-CoA/oxaloacetate decarboxylase gamma subunit
MSGLFALLVTLPSPLAALNWGSLWTDQGLPLAVMGLVVVFAALTLVTLFIGLLPRLMCLLHHYHPEPAEIPVPRPVRVAEEEELSDTMVAVIAAVVAHTVRQPHRIVHTRELTSEDLSWTLEGRLRHHTSHNPIHR